MMAELFRKAPHLPAIAAVLAALCACGGGPPESGDWFLALGGDTLKVEEAASRWRELDADGRRGILDSEDPVAEYVIWLARREMVLREIRRLSYMYRPEVEQMVRAERRRRMAAVAGDSAVGLMERGVSRREITDRSLSTAVRLGLLRDSLLQSALNQTLIDTAAIVEMAHSLSARGFVPDPGAVIVSGPEGRWTEPQLAEEVRYASLRGPADPSSPRWLLLLVRRMLLRKALAAWLREVRPEAWEQALPADGELRQRCALELIRSEMVEDSAEVTRREVEERYRSLSEPPRLPQRRRLQIVVFPWSEAPLFTAIADSGGSPPSEFDACPLFLDEQRSDGTTMPLEADMLPSALADAAFSLDPEDTLEWHGPVRCPELELMAGLRLRRVLPAREATLEEAYASLRNQIRREKALSRLEKWMTTLEERYGLSVNDRILDRLPADPGRWAEL